MSTLKKGDNKFVNPERKIDAKSKQGEQAMSKPEKLPNPSQKALDKLDELDLEFPEVDFPQNDNMPDLPDVPMASPELPELPVLDLPEQALSDVEIPAAQLPTDLFDLGWRVYPDKEVK